MSKRTKIRIFVGCFIGLLIILLATAAVLQYNWWNKTYISIHDQAIRRDVTTLDFHGQQNPDLTSISTLTNLEMLNLTNTGITIEQYQQLQTALPNCTIIWSVPFQGNYLSCTAEQLTVSSLTQEDIDLLAYFPNLVHLDASACTQQEILLSLRQQMPELNVIYTVQLGNEAFSYSESQITLTDVTAEEFNSALLHMNQLEKVTFLGKIPDLDQICSWKNDYPQITFVWDFELFGITANSLDTELILNDIAIPSAEAVEAFYPCFYNLQKVELSNTGIASVDLDALWKRHPDTRVIWTVHVGKAVLRTDTTTFMPYHHGYKDGSSLKDEDLGELKYCTDIICLDLGHMGISDYSYLEYMPNMQYLILADTDGLDFSVLANLKELRYLEIFMTSFDQAEVLTGLTKLEDLNIGTSPIKNVEPLKQMTWLKNLWLPACKNVRGTVGINLKKALPDTNVMLLGAGSTGNGWRDIPNYFAMRDLLGMPYSKGW